MKKIYKVLFVLLFFIFNLCGCFSNDIINLNSSGKNVVCFGDSITMGYGAKRGDDYPTELSKLTNYSIVNSGIDGETSSEGLKRLKSDVLDREPLLVIVEFGGNDFLRRVPFEETISNIEQMIQTIQNSGAMVALVDLGINFPEDLARYSIEYKRLSEKYKTIFIPKILKGIIADISLKSDVLHPNSKGYKIIAYRVYRAIIPYLNQNKIGRSFNKKLDES